MVRTQTQDSAAAATTQVASRAGRRRFTADYKASVVQQAAQCRAPGEIGALLRREGLFSSQLTMWRRERETGALEALSRRRGRKAKLSAEQKRVAALEARNARLERELSQARLIIDVQKKLCTLLGLPTAADEASTGSES